MTIKDTYAETRIAIAKHILLSPLVAFVGRTSGDKNWELTRLQKLASGETKESSYSVAEVVFCRAGTEVTLTVRLDVQDWDAPYVQDEAGSDFMGIKYSAELNWPAHGGTSPTLAKERAELYRDVAILAEEIESLWKTGYRFVRTKEERDALDAKKAEEAHQNLVEKTVLVHSKGLRKGASVIAPPVKELPSGTYTYETKGKKFTLLVKGAGQVTLVRVD